MSLNTTEKQAKTKAEALAKRLGPSWHPKIWENLGWHWKARHTNGTAVYPGDGLGSFMVFSSKPGETGGTYARHGRTAVAALIATLDAAEAELKERAADVRRLRDAYNDTYNGRSPRYR